MRIPTSSSILLATLAISSSSTCLAAPTGDTPQDGISASNSRISSMYDSEVPRGYPGGMPIYERDGDIQSLQVGTTSTVFQILTGLPFVGEIINKVLSRTGTASTQSVNSQDLDALQNAVARITAALNGTLSETPVPNPVKGATGAIMSNTPLGTLSDNDTSSNSNSDPASASTSMSSSSTTYPTSTDNGSAAPSGASHTSAAASPSTSPSMPVNPPNTPSLPVNV